MVSRRRAVRVEYFPPNWFACVMGTAIISIAIVALPGQSNVIRESASGVFWLLSATALVLVAVTTAQHWRRYPATARGYHLDLVVSHFYGAVPMAVLAVGAATLLTGQHVIGIAAATYLDWLLWVIGTVGGLVTLVTIPYLGLTRRSYRRTEAFGGWLMPVVAPMASASTGALLIRHAPIWMRGPMLVFCYLLFALSLTACVIVIGFILARLASGDRGPAAMVPTLWIVLGPLGQSITAANLLGTASRSTSADNTALHRFGIVYGCVVWVLASVWIAIASRHTLRIVRTGLPFALTWWSFTFPVGTYVTGSAALASQTHFPPFATAAFAAFAVLLVAWLVVTLRTVNGIRTGALLSLPVRRTAFSTATQRA